MRPMRLVREHPLGTFGALILLVLILVSIFADSLAPFRFAEINLDNRLAEPSGQHPLGTDQLGRDFLSRLIHGARLSLFVGLTATTLHVVVATLIGGTAGFVGGKFDLVVQRFVDAWMSIPGLLLLLTIMSLAGRGLLQVILVLGVSSGITNSRVVRGAVIAIKENDYFRAARAVGSPLAHTLLRHVLPNVMPPIIIIFSITIGAIIVAEASLSFLGFGLPPEVPSWGGMLSREGRQYMTIAPRLAIWPGLCLTIVVYGINMFGDAVRDQLDPRLRGGGGRYGTSKRQARSGASPTSQSHGRNEPRD